MKKITYFLFGLSFFLMNIHMLYSQLDSTAIELKNVKVEISCAPTDYGILVGKPGIYQRTISSNFANLKAVGVIHTKEGFFCDDTSLYSEVFPLIAANKKFFAPELCCGAKNFNIENSNFFKGIPGMHNIPLNFNNDSLIVIPNDPRYHRDEWKKIMSLMKGTVNVTWEKRGDEFFIEYTVSSKIPKKDLETIKKLDTGEYSLYQFNIHELLKREFLFIETGTAHILYENADAIIICKDINRFVNIIISDYIPYYIIMGI